MFHSFYSCVDFKEKVPCNFSVLVSAVFRTVLLIYNVVLLCFVKDKKLGCFELYMRNGVNSLITLIRSVVRCLKVLSSEMDQAESRLIR